MGRPTSHYRDDDGLAYPTPPPSNRTSRSSSRRRSTSSAKQQPGPSPAVLALFQADALKPPKQQKGEPLQPTSFTVSNPSIDNLAFSSPLSSSSLFKVSLPFYSTLYIDGSTHPLTAYSDSSTSFGRLALDLTRGGREPLRLYAKRLVLRPVYGVDRDGRFEVRLRFEGGSFETPGEVCGSMGL
ncbi:hypothetical protein JCM8547_002856 [Rhodosporidiobolus lusitaniae]